MDEQKLAYYKIVEASQLPMEEKVYLKKDWLGWRVVHPEEKWYKMYKRDWFYLIVCILMVALFYVGVNELISHYKVIADNPCHFCKDCASILDPLI
jgi:hypothetical protein